MKMMNMMIVAMAAAGIEKGGGSALAEQLQHDADGNQARQFHDHVYNALVNGASDETITAAIESAKDKLKAAWEAEGMGNPWPGIRDFEAHELETAKFRVMMEASPLAALFGDDDDLDEDE